MIRTFLLSTITIANLMIYTLQTTEILVYHNPFSKYLQMISPLAF